MIKRALGLVAAGVLVVSGSAGWAHEAKQPGTKEQKMSLNDLPAPVRQGFEQQAKGGKIDEVVKQTQANGSVSYLADVTPKGGKELDVEIAPNGKVISSKPESEENEAHEKE